MPAGQRERNCLCCSVEYMQIFESSSVLSLVVRKQGLPHLSRIYFRPPVAGSVVPSDRVWDPRRRGRGRRLRGCWRSSQPGVCCPCPALHSGHRGRGVSSSVKANRIRIQGTNTSFVVWHWGAVVETITSWSMQWDQCSRLLETSWEQLKKEMMMMMMRERDSPVASSVWEKKDAQGVYL